MLEDLTLWYRKKCLRTRFVEAYDRPHHWVWHVMMMMISQMTCHSRSRPISTFPVLGNYFDLAFGGQELTCWAWRWKTCSQRIQGNLCCQLFNLLALLRSLPQRYTSFIISAPSNLFFILIYLSLQITSTSIPPKVCALVNNNDNIHFHWILFILTYTGYQEKKKKKQQKTLELSVNISSMSQHKTSLHV